MERTIPRAKQWRIFVDVATVVWLTLFVVALTPVSPLDTKLADRLGLGLLAVFVADLAVLYYRVNLPAVAFVRRHWLSILLVIPYFRIFRVLRAVRMLRVLRLLQQPRPAAAMRGVKLGLSGMRAAKKSARAGASAFSPGPRFSWTPDWGRLPRQRRCP